MFICWNVPAPLDLKRDHILWQVILPVINDLKQKEKWNVMCQHSVGSNYGMLLLMWSARKLQINATAQNDRYMFYSICIVIFAQVVYIKDDLIEQSMVQQHCSCLRVLQLNYIVYVEAEFAISTLISYPCGLMCVTALKKKPSVYLNPACSCCEDKDQFASVFLWALHSSLPCFFKDVKFSHLQIFSVWVCRYWYVTSKFEVNTQHHQI